MEYATPFPKSFQCYKPINHKVYGSVAMTPENTVLMVKGRKSGKWSFPKGHKNRGESYLDCALRETEEETGVVLKNHIPVGFSRLSVGEYFFFEVDNEMPTHVNDTREVLEARWVPMSDLCSMPCNVDVNNFLIRLNRRC